jgi:hypothetical protein
MMAAACEGISYALLDFTQRVVTTTYAELLLLLDIIVHGVAENPALVEEPRLLPLVNVGARREHVGRLGYLVQEDQPAAYFGKDLVEDALRHLLAMVSRTVVS